MEYNYGLPYTVKLNHGEYFPPEGDNGLYEVLGVHYSAMPGACLALATILDDGENALIQIDARGFNAHWFVDDNCRFTVIGAETNSALLQVRTVTEKAAPRSRSRGSTAEAD